MKRSAFYLPIVFFTISFILLTLPGNDLPKSRFFDFEGFDKIVHISMFFLLTFLFCRPFKFSLFTFKERNAWFIRIALYALLYGIIMEFVQKYFVPFRSFDVMDIVADGVGASTGYFISRMAFSPAKTA